MKIMTTIIDYLEEYFLIEGISSLIFNYRKSSILKTPPISIVILWFGGIWLSTIIIHYQYTGIDRLWISIFSPILVIFVFINTSLNNLVR